MAKIIQFESLQKSKLNEFNYKGMKYLDNIISYYGDEPILEVEYAGGFTDDGMPMYILHIPDSENVVAFPVYNLSDLYMTKDEALKAYNTRLESYVQTMMQMSKDELSKYVINICVRNLSTVQGAVIIHLAKQYYPDFDEWFNVHKIDI